MNKKFIAVALLGVSLLGLTGCNTVARSFGGTVTLDLPAGQNLDMITWKDDALWYLTSPRAEGEEPETLVFQADTNFGVLEGKVIIQEH